MKSAEDPSYLYVDSNETLKTLVAKTSQAKTVAIDTEADSLHHYFEKVCLIQVTIDGEHFIVDPLAGVDLHRHGMFKKQKTEKGPKN